MLHKPTENTIKATLTKSNYSLYFWPLTNLKNKHKLACWCTTHINLGRNNLYVSLSANCMLCSLPAITIITIITTITFTTVV